jgi:hypothetical protein
MVKSGGGIAKQIIGSFEDIGEKIVQEVTQAPKDIVGKALESVGAGTGGAKAGSKNPHGAQSAGDAAGPKDGWSSYDQAGDLRNRQAIAREALAALTRRRSAKEPGVYERQQQEKEQMKEAARHQEKQAGKTQLPRMSFRKKRGDMHNAKSKQTATEIKGKGSD